MNGTKILMMSRTTTLHGSSGGSGAFGFVRRCIAATVSTGSALGLIAAAVLFATLLFATPAQAQFETQYRVGIRNAIADPIEPILAAPGETFSLQFFYMDLDDSIQGYQVAIATDPMFTFAEDFTTTGTILDAIGGAEFVAPVTDGWTMGGGGPAYAVGILLDVAPPFDGQTAPPTFVFLEIGRVDVTVDPAAIPGEVFNFDFQTVMTTSGSIIENTVSVNFASFPVTNLVGTTVTISDTSPFKRGDVDQNGSLGLNDLVQILSLIFIDPNASTCRATADIDGSGFFGISDFFLLAEHIYMDAPPPAAPFAACAAIANEDCTQFSGCP